MTNELLLQTVVTAADDKKALDIVALDMREVSGVMDTLVVMEGMNSRQIDAIVDNIAEAIKKDGGDIHGIEGAGADGWVLIDLIDVVINVMTHDARLTYRLEKLWHDAPEIDVTAWLTD
ncbi:ribosome silencing factor [Pseudolactococcus carnosus]|uniref:Ribosomal silencing factor RsfS n=1 Tax=Pseudolactococcus carnosus TaxID=2749961 RepID=A0ABT0ASF6_9LACT|nr:ribosome silencing factor [Lactococcus carnosus]SOB47804.1 ribosomal silencing factor [Lactococcus piscium]MCJ1969526.1 ribosome silencing factor [Lactococcus carnosus]MCJ1972674.1 ribosome silencing factor [Lactococcus carnosus]MCJ1982360.1 ribosome silencing factor [Lactococcus carnosus]MCJ1987706.1 ribosome silencing factor [Lactococcus carnosus]